MLRKRVFAKSLVNVLFLQKYAISKRKYRKNSPICQGEL